MIKKLRIMVAVYSDIYLPETESNRLRGFFADLDQDDSFLHNHTTDGKQLYRYPFIQYKIIKEIPVIVAIEEGIDSIYPHLMKQTELRIGDKIYPVEEINIQLLNTWIGDSSSLKQYRFLTPWMALNQSNYTQFHYGTKEDRDKLLEKILIGNILSFCKGVVAEVKNNLIVIHNLYQVFVPYKGKKMLGFLGTFETNYCLPDMCGIGKGTSRGYGTIAGLSSV